MFQHFKAISRYLSLFYPWKESNSWALKYFKSIDYVGVARLRIGNVEILSLASDEEIIAREKKTQVKKRSREGRIDVSEFNDFFNI